MTGAALAAALCLTTLAGTTATAVETDADTAAADGRSGAAVTARLLADASGTETVFVRLSGRSAYDAWRGSRIASGGATAAAQAAAQEEQRVERDADALLDVARQADADAQLLYSTSNAVPGLVLRADAAVLETLAEDDRVESISRVVPKTIDNIGAVQTTRTLAQWQSVGLLGDDVSIGIVDTGIDYTHAGFGGPGTVAAYEAARADDTWTPTAKVVGGYDFAGDDYNADPTSKDYQPVPSPDPDPLDCHGHGSHVAGTAAGYGVTADGATFGGEGDAAAYTGLTEEALESLRIGPGTAPLADLYGLRVFGCGGSTELTMEALDWALDPNGDHSFDDRLDIVNLSLGSDYGAEDDPENLFVEAMSRHGVLLVTSAGNAGDLTAVGGGAYTSGHRALTVANTVSGRLPMDQLVVTEPAEVAGTYPGQFSVAFDYEGYTLPSTPVVVLATVGDGENVEGCDPYSTEEAAAVAGAVVWVEWPVAFACGSAARANNAAAAGAAGILFSSEEAVFSAGLSGNDRIPLFQFTSAGTEVLRAAAEAGDLAVEFDGSLRAVPTELPEVEDLINPGTSRGSFGAATVVKPDVAAPGTMIGSVGVGTGDRAATMTGTSMASPHVAGIAALVRQAHPDWTVEQVKADVMNTAGRDVFTEPGRNGDVYGPNRVGAGRVDAQAAATNELLAYVGDGSGSVSVSFGVVEAPVDGGPVVLSKDVTVENTGDTAVSAALAYSPAVEQPGVAYSVAPATVTVPAGGTASSTVTVTITPEALRKTIDPTMIVEETGFDEPVARQFLSDASGRLLVTPSGSTQALRVPVHTAAKPVSTTTATFGVVGGQPSVVLHGAGVDQGTAGQDAYVSLASVHQLAGVSPRQPVCTVVVTTGCIVNSAARAGDLRHVGVSSTVHDAADPSEAVLTFALSTWGNWTVPGVNVLPMVEIWTDPEREIPNFALLAEPYPDTDVYFVDLYKVAEDGTAKWVSDSPMNVEEGDVDTNLFNNNVALLPVTLGSLYPDGVPADATIEFAVSTETSYPAPGNTGSVLDAVPGDGGRLSFDPADPQLWAATESGTSPLWRDQGGTVIPVERRDGATADKLMVVHQHGPTGSRADILTFRTDAPTDFGPAIEWMMTNGIATGYADGFRPATNVSRQAMAAFMYRFAHGGREAPACTTAPFPDVTGENQFCGAIQWLKESGLSTGYEDGTFRPTAPISRQAMAAFLERFAGDQGNQQDRCVAVSGFPDVARGDQFCDEIRWLTAETGIASGYVDGQFGPARPVTRQAMASFLSRYAELLA